MNLILFDDSDIVRETSHKEVNNQVQRVVLRDRRLDHLVKVLKAKVGDQVQMGVVGGMIGNGTILDLNSTAATIEVTLHRNPPLAVEISVVLALPRPPMLRRLLQAVVTLGVKELVLLNSARVEKSFWQSSVLESESIEHQLRLGLEQAIDTVLPVVRLEQRFRPFVEDELPDRTRQGEVVVADPRYESRPMTPWQGTLTLVIGPEGGFVPFEIDLLESVGASGVGLGERILRVETAVISLLSRSIAVC